MNSTGARPDRRTVLTAGVGAALAAVATAAPAHAAPGRGERVGGRLRALERTHEARLGAFAYDTGTGRTVAYRADERFPMASLFKTLAVAAVLRDLDRDGEVLARRLHYTERYVRESGFSPVTGLPENLANGMTVAELCDATLTRSDNTAGNLLLRELGGPAAVTRFCRSAGDGVTRLDRWEPELNSAEPWRVTDTTSPRAIGRTYGRLLLGDVLAAHDRERLTRWMLANRTSDERFRKGLPADWLLADKTGGGGYGGNNDAGVAWPPGRPPVVLAVLTTRFAPDAAADDALVAEAAGLLAEAVG
ncbi:class A beta-lactamase [Streptomyces somaliensis]|uniref:class A beta-lactamase n=1 Tax=Streptomyces somaliensis TaxID=78355 RepID=UPI0020CFDB8F|nr:class A beta-lactamase [Streptomyces somaliensis]MCP9943763.1 class A beta-lactamase [Streptomyces somaliensis]MCP9975835.1 class A beta-lactamase [Streptomyces somaliensis]